MAKLIGTAGHVDHGKTTLIRALTGIDADRLPEEKRRGMTIDIGFAYVDLPGIGRVSIVDVPGHEKFITNMLVGALGIDVALLCVAADESVMPQTREHLQILALLPVDKLVVALTRADLADADTRELVTAEVEELIAGSRFQKAPIIEVAAIKGDGIEELKIALTEALTSPFTTHDPTPICLPWYLPIDRVFAVKGHGCVVTGTLAQGTVKTGDKALIMPGDHEVRVRAIHSHDESLEAGEKGRRIALNLSGIKLEEVRRGQAVGAPGALFETRMLDAMVTWVAERKHGLRVRVSVGSEEGIGKVFLSDSEPGIVQVRLEAPIACALDQPLIIRRYSPPDLLAGGRIVVPHARPRRKSESVAIVSKELGDAEAVLQVVGQSKGGVTTDEVCRALGKTSQDLGKPFEELLGAGRIRGFAGLWLTQEGFVAARDRFLAALSQLHEANPTLATLPRERVVAEARLPWSGKPLDRIIASLAGDGLIRAEGTAIRDPNFQISLSGKQGDFLARVVAQIEKAGISTPSVYDLAQMVAAPVQAVEEIIRLGVESGRLVRIADGIFYSPRQLEGIQAKVREFSLGKPFAASEMRDAFATSRKYIIPLLEYFDSIRFTLRVGDNRVVRDAGKPG